MPYISHTQTYFWTVKTERFLCTLNTVSQRFFNTNVYSQSESGKSIMFYPLTVKHSSTNAIHLVNANISLNWMFEFANAFISYITMPSGAAKPTPTNSGSASSSSSKLDYRYWTRLSITFKVSGSQRYFSWRQHKHELRQRSRYIYTSGCLS